MKEKKFDLEERLIDFAVAIVLFVESLPWSRTSVHLGGQLLRSGTSPSGESKNDFIHKMKVCLKELRESYNCLRILHRAKKYKSEQDAIDLINECNELISIFIKSIVTANKKKF
jgi:four helix bundle protein